jgi:hypothetical protein
MAQAAYLGIPVLRPTLEQFRSFSRLLQENMEAFKQVPLSLHNSNSDVD